MRLPASPDELGVMVKTDKQFRTASWPLPFVELKGRLFPSIRTTSGVHEGRLLPSLFVIFVDVLLRRVHQWFPDSIVRAYADDPAVIIPTLFELVLVSSMFINNLEKSATSDCIYPKRSHFLCGPLSPTHSRTRFCAALF